jgi:ligand-binding sensor domain-containing protein
MANKNAIVLLAASNLLIVSGYCQNYAYEKITIKDGLLSDNIYQIIADTKGYLWFATDKGICKYDGKNFNLIEFSDQKDKTLDMFGIHNIGDEIIARSWNHLYKIKKNKIQVINDFHSKQDFFKIIGADLYNNFWILIDPVTLVKYAENKCSYTDISRLVQNNETTQYYFDQNKYLILRLFPSNRLFCFKENKFIEITGNFSEKMKNIFIEKSINDQNKNLILVYSPEIYSEKIIVSVFDSLNHEKVFRLNGLELNKYSVLFLKSFDHNLFLTLRRGLLLIKNYDRDNYETEFLFNNLTITGIERDFSGNYWIATNSQGAMKLNGFDIHQYLENLPEKHQDFTRIITLANKTIWVSSSNGKIMNVLNPGQIFPFPQLISNKFFYGDKNNTIYYGGEVGLYKNETVLNPKILIKDVWPLSDGFLIGTFSSILKYSLDKDASFHTDTIIRQRATSVCMDYDSVIWYGNESGLYKLTAEAKKSNEICILNESITDISSSRDSVMWVATNGGILYSFKKNNVKKWNISHQSFSISSLITDTFNRIWLATNMGIFMLKNSDKTEENQIIHIDKNWGFPKNYFNDLSIQGNDIWVASNEAVYNFNYNHIKSNDTPPKIIIESIALLNDHTKIESESLLKYNQNSLEVKYTGISLTGNREVTYEYRLLPLTPDWISTPNSSLQFSGLKPGRYIFEIKTINAYSIPSELEKISFTIIEPWWQTGTFTVAAIFFSNIVIIGFGFFLYNRKKEKALERKALQEKIVSAKLEALQAQLNPHFVFNSLNSIQQLINEDQKEKANYYLIKFSGLMRLYLISSKNRYIPLKNELEMLDLYGELEQLRYDNKFKLKITLSPGIKSDEINVPPMLFQPFVENAIRHGRIYKRENGEVTVGILRKNDQLLFSIRDNGIGRRESKSLKIDNGQHQSLGEELSRKRMEAIKSLEGKNLDITIIDHLFPDGTSAGTEVNIRWI